MIGGGDKYCIEGTKNNSCLNNENKCFVSNLKKIVEPKTYEEASLDSNWIKDMHDEMDALYRNHTWDITTLPKKS